MSCGPLSAPNSPQSQDNEAITVGIFKQLMRTYITPVNKSLDGINASIKQLTSKITNLENRVSELKTIEKANRALLDKFEKKGKKKKKFIPNRLIQLT